MLCLEQRYGDNLGNVRFDKPRSRGGAARLSDLRAHVCEHSLSKDPAGTFCILYIYTWKLWIHRCQFAAFIYCLCCFISHCCMPVPPVSTWLDTILLPNFVVSTALWVLWLLELFLICFIMILQFNLHRLILTNVSNASDFIFNLKFQCSTVLTTNSCQTDSVLIVQYVRSRCWSIKFNVFWINI